MSNDENLSSETGVVSYLTLRKTIGWLGMLLPFLLLTGNYLLNNVGVFNNNWFVQLHDNYSYVNEGSYKSSVSHYYYTTVGEIFTGTLFAVALFLICYTGHPIREGERGFSDNAMSNLAGIFALGVIMFPTDANVEIRDNLRSFISTKAIGIIHLVFAGSFLLVLALMSMVNFRRAKRQELFGTGKDDPFYLNCGVVMIACLVLIAIFMLTDSLQSIHPTFVLEAVALVAFGASWLRKGQADLLYVPKRIKKALSKEPKDVSVGKTSEE